MTRLLMLAGDGIGPEMMAATRLVLDAADTRFALGLAFEEAVIGFDALAASGSTIPDAVIEQARAKGDLPARRPAAVPPPHATPAE